MELTIIRYTPYKNTHYMNIKAEVTWELGTRKNVPNPPYRNIYGLCPFLSTSKETPSILYRASSDANSPPILPPRLHTWNGSKKPPRGRGALGDKQY